MIAEIFTAPEAYLISLSASVAAGCVPCADYYVDRARGAGVGDDDLREAVALAESVRREATTDVACRVRGRIHPETAQATACASPAHAPTLLSLAAAYAVNSHALVMRALGGLRAQNVPPDKIAEAIQIARGARNMAIAIVDRTAEREAGVPPDREAPPSCVCG